MTTARLPRPTASMQQATVNLLADMGAQPARCSPGLVPATRPPTSLPRQSRSPRPPPAPTSRRVDRHDHRHGGRRRRGGRRGVEVSIDGGQPGTRPPGVAPGPTPGRRTLGRADQGPRGRRQRKSRGRLRRVTVNPPAPMTLWAPVTVPAIRPTRHVSEVGVKFRSDVNGYDHRDPVLQGDEEHRHAYRQLWNCRAGPCQRRRSAARRPPAGRALLCATGPDHRQHDLCRFVPYERRALRRGRLLFRQLEVYQWYDPRPGERDRRPERRLHLRATTAFPNSTYLSPPTFTWTCCSTRPPTTRCRPR